METRSKRHFRGLTSQAPSEDFNIVKPYWVARNFIPPILKQKCQGNHSKFRLPLIQSYLKKKESNLLRKQMSRTQVNESDIGLSNHYRNASQSDAQGDALAECKVNPIGHFISSTHESIIQSQHLSQKQGKPANLRGVVLSECRIEEETLRLPGVSSPQWKPSVQSLRAYHDPVLLSTKQRQPLRNKFNTFLTSQSKYAPGSSKNIQSPRNNLAVVTPSKDSNSICKQLCFQHKVQSQKRQKLRILETDQQHRKQNQLGLNQPGKKQPGLNQFQTQLKDRSFDKSKIAISKAPKDSNSSQLINKQQLSFESENPVVNKPARHDKSALIQSYKQTFKTLQTTIKKKGRTSKIDNTRIMELMAKLKVIKKHASIQEKGLQLEKYVDQLGIQVVQEIGMVLENNQQFKSIQKRINLEWETVELVSRKVTEGRRNGRHFMPLMGLDQSGDEQADTIGLGALSKLSGFTKGLAKTHNRYHSDSNLDKKPKRVLDKHDKPDQGQLKLDQQQQEAKEAKQHRTIKESESVQVDRMTLKKDLLGTKAKSKHTSHTVHKNESNLELISKSSKKLKAKVRKQIVGSHQNTQRSPINNRKNGNQRKKPGQQIDRPNSYKQQGSTLMQEGQNFRSEKVIYSNKKLFKSKKSFLDSIQKIKARLIKNSQSQLPSSIVSSNQTTPPPELIHEIHDDILENLRGRKVGGSQHNRNQLSHQQDQQHQDTVKVKGSKVNGKINRFKINMYDRVDYPYRSSQSEEDSEDIPSERSVQRFREEQLGVNWNNIIKRIPKRRVFKPYKREQVQLKKSKKFKSYLSRHLMESLHSQIYRIMEEQDRTQLKELKEQLFANQQQIRQARIKAESIPQEWFLSEQNWIDELDFGLKIVTKNMEHLGTSKIPMMIMRNHDAQNDPIDLYEIACRESKLADKLQEKQRLYSFANESLYLCEMNQDKGHKMNSYQF